MKTILTLLFAGALLIGLVPQADASIYYRHHRHHHRVIVYSGYGPYYSPYYAPYYRPYYRPYYARPGVSFSLGF